MCLTLGIWPFNRIRTAKKDIVCYKFLRRKGEQLITPYQYTFVEIGETYDSKLRKDFQGDIEEGLHSFKRLKAVDSFVEDNYYKTLYSSIVIVKCIIPKGSTYYKGRYASSTCYASDTLKYVEIFKTIKT